jgi:ribosomal protein L7/L12
MAIFMVALVVGSALTGAGFAAEAHEQAVRSFHEQWAAAWNAKDSEGIAAFYDVRASAHFDLVGNRHMGREEIRQHFASQLTQGRAIRNPTFSVTRSTPASTWVRGTFEWVGPVETSTVHFEHGIDVASEDWLIFASVWMTPEAWAAREKKRAETRKEAEAAAPKPEGPLREELVTLLKSGEKITAIRRYREETGVGLAAAKKAIDELEAELAK